MKSLKCAAAALCAAMVLSGCNISNTAKGTAIGAGGGAALGAITMPTIWLPRCLTRKRKRPKP